MRRPAVFLIAALLAGCAIGTQYRMERFEATARAYARALRWSDFQGAFGVVKPPTETRLPDFHRLKVVRITSYETLSTVPNADGNVVRQMVEISYVHTDRMVERKLMDNQDWAYSEADKRWYLRSDFPEFR
jgi:hypothetical protein